MAYNTVDYGKSFNDAFTGMGNFILGKQKQESDLDQRKLENVRADSAEARAVAEADRSERGLKSRLETEAEQRLASKASTEQTLVETGAKRKEIEEKEHEKAYYAVDSFYKEAKKNPELLKNIPSHIIPSILAVRRAAPRINTDPFGDNKYLLSNNNVFQGTQLVSSMPKERTYDVDAKEDPRFSDFLASAAFIDGEKAPYARVKIVNGSQPGDATFSFAKRDADGKLVYGEPVHASDLMGKTGASLNTELMLKELEGNIGPAPFAVAKTQYEETEKIRKNQEQLGKILTPEFRTKYASNPDIQLYIKAAEGGTMTAAEFVNAVSADETKKMGLKKSQAEIEHMKVTGEAATLQAQAAIARANKDGNAELELKMQKLTMDEQERYRTGAMQNVVRVMATEEYQVANAAKKDEMIRLAQMDPVTQEWKPGTDVKPKVKASWGGVFGDKGTPEVPATYGQAVPRKVPLGFTPGKTTTTVKKVIATSPGKNGKIHHKYSDGTED